MKPTSLKVKMQSIAQNEMQNTMGGADVSAKLKTVVVIGKKKNATTMQFYICRLISRKAFEPSLMPSLKYNNASITPISLNRQNETI